MIPYQSKWDIINEKQRYSLKILTAWGGGIKWLETFKILLRAVRTYGLVFLNRNQAII
jgi:hypothetical protein